VTYADVELNADSKIIQREKIQASSLAKECYSMKLELLTNATLVNGVIRSYQRMDDRSKADSEGKGIKYEINGNIFCKTDVSTYR
jgi:hypothetical protein